MIKKILLALILVLSPFLAGAASVHIGADYFLKGSEEEKRDTYVIAPSAIFAGWIDGDAVALARTVTSDGKVGGDAFFFGETVTVSGEVADDIRVVGGTVRIRGKITGDVVALGARIFVEKEATVLGNVYAVGGEIVLGGAISGEVKAAGGDVSISGSVGGAAEIWGEEIKLSAGSIIGSDFIYHAAREATIASGVHIGGETLFDEQKGVPSGLASFASGFAPFHMLATLAGAFFLFLLFRERTEEVLLDAAGNFWRRVLRGLLFSLLAPLAGVLLILTAIGIPLGFASLALYLTGLIFSAAYGGVLMGVFLERPLFHRSAFPLSSRTVFVGVAFLSLLGAIPYLGFVVVLLFTLASFGSIGTIGWRHLKQMR